MTRSMLLFPAVCAIALAQPACGQARNANAWPNADSVVSIEGKRAGLRVSAWRDFMPQVGGDGSGSPLMVSVQILTENSTPLPTGLTVDSVWVRSPSEVWATAPSDEPRPETGNGMDLMLRGGPKWPTDQLIDVLVRLRLGSGEYYLLAKQQPIGETQ